MLARPQLPPPDSRTVGCRWRSGVRIGDHESGAPCRTRPHEAHEKASRDPRFLFEISVASRILPPMPFGDASGYWGSRIFKRPADGLGRPFVVVAAGAPLCGSVMKPVPQNGMTLRRAGLRAPSRLCFSVLPFLQHHERLV